MASATLRDILGYVSLTKMVNTNVADLPRRLPEPFYMKKSNTEKVEGDFFRFTQFTHARTPAQLSEYYSPSKPVELRPIGQRDCKLFSSYENIKFNAQVLEALRNFNDYGLQEKGKEFVAKQTKEFNKRFDHLEDLIALLVLCKGIVYRNNAGAILPTSSGSTLTADFGIPAGNQGTIAAVSGVGGGWDSPSTQIWLQLQTMKQKAQLAHGYIPEIILYGKNIPTYISNNDSMIPYLSRNPEYRDEWVKKGHIKPTHELCEYTWFPLADVFYNDANGTAQQPISDDAIIMLPAPSDEWWGWAIGTNMIPSTLNIIGNAEASVENLVKMYGRFAYSKLFDDPTSLVGIAGTTFVPYIKIPEVVYQMTAK